MRLKTGLSFLVRAEDQDIRGDGPTSVRGYSTLQEWPEVIACLDAKCVCGTPYYHTVQTLKNIAGCVDTLGCI